MSPSSPAITVIGSINMDLVVRCASLPMPGQTLMAESATEICGGKGANQAVAATRAGGEVTLIGRIGDDAFADRLLANLTQEAIRTDYVQRTSHCASGLAVVAVDSSGQNSIIVVPGANGRVTVDDIVRARSVIESSDVVLIQLEIPMDAVLAAITIAHENNVRVILDPAPAPRSWPEAMFRADLMCPNETEATALTGLAINDPQQAAAAARVFHDRGCPRVAITLGEKGTMLSDDRHAHLVDSYAVITKDTTAAGDAFAGALAVYWAEQGDLAEAVRFGNAAGALSASREGAQPSMARRDEIETLWRSR